MATFTYSASSGDAWANFASIFDNTGVDLFLAGDTGLDRDVKTWIPFTIADIGYHVVIASATIRWVATQDRSEVTIPVLIGCEATVNPSDPTTRADLYGRVMTSAKLSTNLAAYTTGVEYSYDITTAVQEVINMASWTFGSKLAVFVVDNGTGGSDRRLVASTENATYTEPQLDIVVNAFIPEIMEFT